MKINNRMISFGLVLLSLLLLLFGTCVKIDRYSSLFNITDEIMGWVLFFDDEDFGGSTLRDAKALVASFSDGKISGGEAWLDMFRLSKVLNGVGEIYGEDSSGMTSSRMAVLFYEIFFPFTVLWGVLSCAACYRGVKNRYTLIYIVLVALLVLFFLLVKFVKITPVPFLTLAAAVGAEFLRRQKSDRDAEVDVTKIKKRVKDIVISVKSHFKRGSTERTKKRDEPKAVRSFCGNCGCELTPGACFCGRCGKKINK